MNMTGAGKFEAPETLFSKMERSAGSSQDLVALDGKRWGRSNSGPQAKLGVQQTFPSRSLGTRKKRYLKDDSMKGIRFVIDESGKKKAVLIDLEEWGELWEDFYDLMVAESRKDEESIPWEAIKAEMEQQKP
jgi:hypothetical protein